MRKNRWLDSVCITLIMGMLMPLGKAEELPFMDNVLPANKPGRVIQITTQFHSFRDKPVWLLVIEDLDHHQTIPYLFNIQKGNNFWVAYTNSNHYRIAVSTMQFPHDEHQISNFCHLQSRQVQNQSLYLTLSGNLTSQTNTFICHLLK